MKSRKAVFLDRDGTVNKWVGFLTDINDVELLSGAAEAIRRMNFAGYLTIVVTNQPVIARGEVTIEELDAIHGRLEGLLEQEGARLDAIYYCPHHPDGGFPGEIPELKVECDCRKPGTGLVMRAVEKFGIDLSESWFVGDSWRDVQTGINAGMKTCLLTGTGGDKSASPREVIPDVKADNLLEFVENCLGSFDSIEGEVVK